MKTLSNETWQRQISTGTDETAVPFPRSYWVRPGQLLAGCFPGAPGPREASRKLRGMLDAGIRAIINLMEPEETDHQGRSFTQYEDHLYQRGWREGE